MITRKPNIRQTHLFAPNVEDPNCPDKMSLEDMERLLVRKHYRFEMEGNPSAAKVLDQIMKVKEMRERERQHTLEEESAKIKPSIAVIPVFDSYEKWQEIAAKQQEALISETVKL